MNALHPLLVAENHPALHEVASSISFETDDIQGLADLLTRTLEDTQAAGIALPQIGYPLRGFILSKVLFALGGHRLCLNPSFQPAKGAVQAVDTEGCLSLPGKTYEVRRHTIIKATYTQLSGKTVTHTLAGFAARAFQHELDHLNGLLISTTGTPHLRAA